MWKIIGSFFTTNPIGIFIAKWGAIAGAVTAILLGAKQAGRNAERMEQLEQYRKDVIETNKIHSKVSTDDAYRQKIRDRFDAK